MAPSDPEPLHQNATKTFLVVEGSRVMVISEPVVNIGRKNDNQIVIDNEHVSRYHAQIRRIRDRYVILDLNSTVGTSVNGKPIEQAFLSPGDVISVGGVPLIFGQTSEKSEIESLGLDQVKSLRTGTTEINDIRSVDKYLDYFESSDE